MGQERASLIRSPVTSSGLIRARFRTRSSDHAVTAVRMLAWMARLGAYPSKSLLENSGCGWLGVGALAGEAASHHDDHGPVDVGLMVGGQPLVIPDGSPVPGDPGRWVGRAARCQRGLVLFRAASRRTGRDGFPIIRLSSDYCVRDGAGCRVWIMPWQVAQTTRVLRRWFAMALAH